MSDRPPPPSQIPIVLPQLFLIEQTLRRSDRLEILRSLDAVFQWAVAAIDGSGGDVESMLRRIRAHRPAPRHRRVNAPGGCA